MENQKIQWQPMIEMIIVLMTILGSTIPLYIHTDSKLETAMMGIRQEVNSIHSEMKDFHNRLCKIEAERK